MFEGKEISSLRVVIRMGVDDDNAETGNERKSKYIPASRIEERCCKIEDMLNGWCEKKMYPNIFSRSISAKTHLSTQLLHLFPYTSLNEKTLSQIQEIVDDNVNKKMLTCKTIFILN